jgi:Recombination enhancement, RecA-dependent nuclease
MAKDQRFANLKRTGCIPCLLDNFLNSHAEIHHVVEQAYRKGDHRSYSNCAWHHRGIPWEGLQARAMEALLGPSMRLNSKAYHDRYGSELDLIQVQDFVLHLFDSEPWGDHDMPSAVARKVRTFWMTVREQNVWPKPQPLVP